MKKSQDAASNTERQEARTVGSHISALTGKRTISKDSKRRTKSK